MSNFLPHDWWESSVFASSALPFGVAAAQDSYASNNIWEDLDDGIEQATDNTKGLIGIAGMWRNYGMKTIFTLDTVCLWRILMPLSCFSVMKWVQICYVLS
jgi:hypothetical protein